MAVHFRLLEELPSYLPELKETFSSAKIGWIKGIIDEPEG